MRIQVMGQSPHRFVLSDHASSQQDKEQHCDEERKADSSHGLASFAVMQWLSGRETAARDRGGCDGHLYRYYTHDAIEVQLIRKGAEHLSGVLSTVVI